MAKAITTLEKKFIIEYSVLFTIKDFTEILNCSRAAVYRILKQQNIKAVKKAAQNKPETLKAYYILHFRDLRHKRKIRKEEITAKKAAAIRLEKLTAVKKPAKFKQLNIEFSRDENNNRLDINEIPYLISKHYGIRQETAGNLKRSAENSR